jgi:cellulose biosynthesis protein BcsQ
LLSEAVFVCADVLLSPIIPTTLSLRTLEQLKSFIQDSQLKNLTLIPFFSMVDKRKKLHLTLMATLLAEHPEILTTQIPYSSEIEKMGLHRMPLGGYSHKGQAVEAYQQLWQEVLQRL